MTAMGPEPRMAVRKAQSAMRNSAEALSGAAQGVSPGAKNRFWVEEVMCKGGGKRPGEHPRPCGRALSRWQGVEVQQRLEPLEQQFDGLITNDKFCLSRAGQLALNWWRRPLRLRGQAPGGSGPVPDLEGDRGGAHEAPLAGPPPDAAGLGRSTAVGSGIHAHPELEHARRSVGASRGERHLPTISGGEP